MWCYRQRCFTSSRTAESSVLVDVQHENLRLITPSSAISVYGNQSVATLSSPVILGLGLCSIVGIKWVLSEQAVVSTVEDDIVSVAPFGILVHFICWEKRKKFNFISILCLFSAYIMAESLLQIWGKDLWEFRKLLLIWIIDELTGIENYKKGSKRWISCGGVTIRRETLPSLTRRKYPGSQRWRSDSASRPHSVSVKSCVQRWMSFDT